MLQKAKALRHNFRPKKVILAVDHLIEFADSLAPP